MGKLQFSLVAIATAINLTGLGSGAANMGIVCSLCNLFIWIFKSYSLGVNVVLLIGAAKMMIPVYLQHLIIAIPLKFNGVICGIVAYILKIKGTALSAVLVILDWLVPSMH
ncbi:PTS sugar transporter subunit IIC [Staphylococcus epidermidis]|uniref:PTS sugar transporter subunit IIC n=1 Tax=Staphylococcus epidermidis TaxID=1282 RepID=UPI00266B4C37|nr:PTS sugar transporter subunit IIC [Staphylococcus epidermidis]MDO2946793.1 PTS sugar transporter subunit IIC [Staphylococcus epidermidis]